MSTLSVRLPESLHKELKKIAKEEKVSINQFISSAAAEKISAMMTVDYLKKEAKLGKRKDFESLLNKVPDVEPEPYDRLDKS
ncbi:MAG: toxin-antitoxin system HicB family antitoxin [Candidatus Brocadiaceae bacterium]|nr:toxin-antitoxin system HicB family antitoxin [Candidatus Brocadiaceae bacterium]